MNDVPATSTTGMAEFWRAALVGAPAVLQLGADRPRPKTLSYQVGHASLEVPEDVSNRARHVATTVGCNPRDVLLCALAVACFRYSGQDDIVVGTPFVRSDGSSAWLPIRCDFSEDPVLTKLLDHVVAATGLAAEHCEIDRDALIAASMDAQTESHAPIFQVAGSTSHGPSPRARTPFPVPPPSHVPLDLVVQLVDREAEMQLNAEFARDLFDDETIADLLVRLARIIFAIGDDPNVRASAVALLRDDEIDRSLVSARGPDRELPDECLHDAIERQILATPDAPAVTDHEQIGRAHV